MREREFGGATAVCTDDPWVSESRFGDCFLATEIWRKYVLEVAFENVVGLIGPRRVRAHRLRTRCV